jgi:uncharacterized membrane protein (UPF0127 family)
MAMVAGAMAVLIAGCSPGAGNSTAAPPAETAQETPTVSEAGLQVIPLTVTHDGKTHRFSVEVAATPQQQAKGMMFRTQMGADEGMLFPYDPPRTVSFWMKNTVIPLDIVNIGTDGLVLNIHENATPYSEQKYWSDGPVSAVLELRGGRAAELGIAPGARVSW